jgi:hypothetical protein
MQVSRLVLQEPVFGRHTVWISAGLLVNVTHFSAPLCKFWNNTFKQSMTATYKILTYSSFTFIFQCHLTLYILCGWNNSIK